MRSFFRMRTRYAISIGLKRLGILAPLGVHLLVAPVRAEEPPAFASEREKVSYALGVNVMSNMQKQGFDVDPDAVARGMKDAIAGKYLLSDEEIRIAIDQYRV